MFLLSICCLPSTVSIECDINPDPYSAAAVDIGWKSYSKSVDHVAVDGGWKLRLLAETPRGRVRERCRESRLESGHACASREMNVSGAFS